jgi:hypothetical protein
MNWWEWRDFESRKREGGFYFLRAGIGGALRTLHSGVSSEAIPEGMADLVKRLDQPMENDQDTDERKRRHNNICEQSTEFQQ